ncbi:MAG: DNA repair protein RecO [Verrucomicrobia bacterium]|nr:DNA repair protein RecO [Verrucomicrobiota bacterium]
MNEARGEALALRVRLVSETSLIVHWLTREHGRMATMARGALRPKSPFRGKLDLLHQCEILWVKSHRGDLHALKEVQFVRGWPGLRAEIGSLRAASCAIRWVEHCTEADTPLPGLFELLNSMLDGIESQEDAPMGLIRFEVRFMDWLGLLPASAEFPVRSEGRTWLERFRKERGCADAEFLPGQAGYAVFLRAWEGFLVQQFGRLPTGRREALAVVS